MTIIDPNSQSGHNPEDARGAHESFKLDPARKIRLANLFMHNPNFAETFFKARLGQDGMNRFKALQDYIHQMSDLELGVILDSPHNGTMAILSRFFDSNIPTRSSESISNDKHQGKKVDRERAKIEENESESEAESESEKVKMNQWCWIFLGAYTVGEAGRTLNRHQK